MPKIKVKTFRYDPESDDGQIIDKWISDQACFSESVRRLILRKPLPSEDILKRISEIENKLRAISTGEIEISATKESNRILEVNQDIEEIKQDVKPSKGKVTKYFVTT